MTPEQIKVAREALDNLDDYARMDTGVNAYGPRGVLEAFIDAVERALSAQDEVLTDEKITFDRRWSLPRDGFGLERNDETGEYVTYDDAVAVLHAALAAAAPSPAVALEPVAQGDIRGPLTDSQRQHARSLYANLRGIQDGIEAVIRYISTSAYSNGVQDMRIESPATPSPSLAVRDGEDAARYRWLKSKGGIDERDGGYHKSYWLPRITKEGGTIDKPIYHADFDSAIDAAMREKP